MIQMQEVNDMVNALRNVSGVSAQRWYGMYEYYKVRGFNIADVILVDGMRLEGNRINTQLNNVEQVDVLKGPSSFLYGGQALSGPINVVRKKPQGTRVCDFFYRVGRRAYPDGVREAQNGKSGLGGAHVNPPVVAKIAANPFLAARMSWLCSRRSPGLAREASARLDPNR